MRVTLVYKGRYHIREALDLETLAALLRLEGHPVTLVYHPDAFGVTDNVLQCSPLAGLLANDEGILERIVDSQPDAVVFSVLSQTHTWCRALAKRLKSRLSSPIVFMGLHASLVPERLMEDEAVDYLIQGEAEGALPSLLGALASEGDIEDVGNLWYRKEGGPAFTRGRELVDLDRLPIPDKELFRPYVSHRYSYSAMVSRGCPFQCSFCEETCMKAVCGPGYFRRKAVDTVMRELNVGKRRYRFKEAIFKDSYLSGDTAWLAELMERYRKEIGVPFKCFCTIVGFTEETARLLKEGGCYSVEFGLQTWNEAMRREVLNRRETNEDAGRAFECCGRHGLHYDIDHMFDLPGETIQDHVEGARRYRDLPGLGRIKVHHLVYLPTADIVRHGQAAGELPEDADVWLAEGLERDFYDPRPGGGGEDRQKAGFVALYKILPLLPRSVLEWLLEGDRVSWLSGAPSLLVAALQGLNAARVGDLRFWAYLHVYPRKIFFSLRQRLSRPSKKR